MSNKPDMAVYFVTERGPDNDKRVFWAKIGAAWSHADGEGLNIALDLIPTDMTAGRIVVRAKKPEGATDGGGE